MTSKIATICAFLSALFLMNDTSIAGPNEDAALHYALKLSAWKNYSWTPVQDFSLQAFKEGKQSFLIHGIAEGALRDIGENTPYKKSFFDLIQSPRNIGLNPTLSTTLISGEVNRAWTGSGLILAPGENFSELILGAGIYPDYATPNYFLSAPNEFRNFTLADLRGRHYKDPLFSPEKLRKYNYAREELNEIFIATRAVAYPVPAQIRVAGFFMATDLKDSAKLIETAPRRRLIEKMAQKHGLPLLKIPLHMR